MPPLRAHREDIPALTETLARRISLRLGIPPKTFLPASLARLQTMEFPGNVRELQNLIERVLIFTQGPEVKAHNIPDGEAYSMLAEDPATPTVAAPAPDITPPSTSSPATLEEIEREAIRQTLHATNGNMYRAARQLNISRSTLYSKVKKLGLARDGKEIVKT